MKYLGSKMSHSELPKDVGAGEDFIKMVLGVVHCLLVYMHNI